MNIEDEKDIVRFYGRRKGKALTVKRQNDLEEVSSKYFITMDSSNEEIDPSSLFSFKPKEIWLEVGFGNGEHLAHQAKNNPEVGLIGCEPFLNGVAALASEIKKNDIKNILIWPEDARLVMNRLKKHSLDRFYLLHADPWPKTRHHKRRFIQTEMLDLISTLLKKEAELRMATDHAGLAEWILDKTYHHPNFEWLAKCASDWQNPPDDWIDTRYCNKGKTKDHIQVYYNFKNKI